MRVVIIGAGAVGLGLGSCLLSAGDSLGLVVRDRAARAEFAREGIRRSGIFGELRHDPRSFEVLDSIAALRGRAADCLLVCTKSSASRAVARALAEVWSHFPSPPALVSCQNGWGNAEAFAEHLPPEHVWNARVITGFRRSTPTQVEITVHAEPVRVGALLACELARDATRIRELCDHLDRGGIPCEYTPDIAPDVLAKLLYNCALNPLGAILGVPYGELAARDETRAVIEAVVREIFDVLAAHQLSTHWASAAAYLDDFHARLLPPTARHESSMLQDLRAGRPSEIDALCGAVVDLGAAASRPTPVNRALLDLLRAIEARLEGPGAKSPNAKSA